MFSKSPFCYNKVGFLLSLIEFIGSCQYTTVLLAGGKHENRPPVSCFFGIKFGTVRNTDKGDNGVVFLRKKMGIENRVASEMSLSHLYKCANKEILLQEVKLFANFTLK